MLKDFLKNAELAAINKVNSNGKIVLLIAVSGPWVAIWG